MPEAVEKHAEMPDMTISVRQVFGIDSDLEAELLVYDTMLNNVQERIICEVCLRTDDKMYQKYYGDMIGERGNDDNPDDDEDIYIY